jgi:hypothetical protein
VVVAASLGFGIWIVTRTHTTAMGNVILFGGDNINSNPINDTWIWNGTCAVRVRQGIDRRAGINFLGRTPRASLVENWTTLHSQIEGHVHGPCSKGREYVPEKLDRV